MTEMASLLDIVIPVRDRADWLELCLLAIERWTRIPHRIFVVDNDSLEKETFDLYERLLGIRPHEGPSAASFELGNDYDATIPRLTLIRRKVNDSFSASVNEGVRAGRSPHVCILNDDAIVTPGWAEALLADLADDAIGMTGARTNRAMGQQGEPLDREMSRIADPLFLVFVCVALRRSTWDRVGEMDAERFKGWGGEDLDYAWRVRKAGLRLKVSDAYVFHGLSQTLKREVGEDEESMTKNNNRWNGVLQRKHGIKFFYENTLAGPRVLVCSFSAEEWTRVSFTQSIVGLALGTPAGVFSYAHPTRKMIHEARQQVCNEARTRGAFTHVLMIDDDQVFPPGALARLLSHRKDVVGALAYQRKSPYNPCAFVIDNEAPLEGHRWPMMRPLECEGTGLVKVDGIGGAMLLVSLSVFEKLDDFYLDRYRRAGLEKTASPKALEAARVDGGKHFAFEDGVGEDIYFCHRLREAGVEVFCDTDLVVGHVGAPVVVDRETRPGLKANVGKGAGR